MARFRAAALIILALAAGAARADDDQSPLAPETAATPAPGTPAGSTPPAKLRVLNRQIAVSPDGALSVTTHSELQILNAAVIPILGQARIPYVESLQSLDIQEAYTLKPDGRKLMVAPGAILTQQQPVSGNTPVFTETKEKVIIFPDVEVGDTLVYTGKLDGKPQFPGQFVYDAVMSPILVVDSEKLTITSPLHLYSDARNVTVSHDDSGATQHWSLSYSNPKGVSSDSDPLSQFDDAPRVSFSSFKDWDAMASAYAAIALPKAVVTQAVQAQADKIVAGASDEREQAKRIYDWISAHVRYVAVALGTDGIIPHDADSVLTNAYGDCKDQAVLFVAMLKAEKIPADLVLLNGLNTYSVAKVPTVGGFDHVIVWLPQWKIYADTTSAGMVPFGQVPLAEAGKPALLVGDAAPGALRQIPAPSARDATFTYTLTATIDDAGHDTSSDSLTATGAFLEPLHGLGRLVNADGGGKLAADLLKARGTPRATGSFTAPAAMSAEPYQIDASYATPGTMSRIAQGQGFAIPDNLRLAALTSSFFFGAVFTAKYHDADPVPCHSGKAVDDETLNFTAARKLVKLPDDKRIGGDHITYNSHWTQSGNSVHVHREFEARFDGALCSGTERTEALTAQKTVADDAKSEIMLQKVAATEGPGPAPAPPP